jgi:putative ABC transport system permease protein
MAGYFGLLAGVFLMEGINKAIEGTDSGMFYQPGVELDVALKALVILIISGALAGIIPARKAIAISPVDALRYE